ncbi:hypothetical protein MBANPS3_006129 [Mucor bainieri]
METRQYKIIQASTLNLLFSKCDKSHKVVFVTKNEFVYGQEMCYCERCNKIVKDKKVTYRLDLAVLDIETNKMESIILYDSEVANAFGCLPDEYLKYLQQDTCLSKKIEELLIGLYCSAKIKVNKEGERKAHKFQLMYADEPKIVDLIRATSDDVRFDPSVL